MPKPTTRKAPRSNQERSAARRARMDAIAQKHGFPTWRRMETAIGRQEVTITITRKDN